MNFLAATSTVNLLTTGLIAAQSAPPALDIYGPPDPANDIVGNMPVEVPHLQDHTTAIALAAVSVAPNLARLTLGTVRRVLPNLLLPQSMKMSTEEAMAASGPALSASLFVGRIAASKPGTALAWIRNIAGAAYAFHDIEPLALIWPCNGASLLLGIGITYSIFHRTVSFFRLRRREKAGQITADERRLHRQQLFGILPHRLPKLEKTSKPEAEAETPPPPPTTEA